MIVTVLTPIVCSRTRSLPTDEPSKGSLLLQLSFSSFMFPAPVYLAPAMCWVLANKNESEIIFALQKTQNILHCLIMYIWGKTANM